MNGTAQPNGVFEDLVQYIRETIPQPKALSKLSVNERGGVVTFSWNGRDFVVKPSLEVFEARGQGIFITGASMLMQIAFLKKRKMAKVVEATMETLKQTEDFFKGGQNDKAFDLLVSVKKAIGTLAGK